MRHESASGHAHGGSVYSTQPLGGLLRSVLARLFHRRASPPNPNNPCSNRSSSSLPISASRALGGLAVVLALAVGLLLSSSGPLHAQDSSTIEYPEKGITEVATFTAVDPEGADITSWTLAGDDADDFTIDGGVLTFTKSPDYEAATDGDRNNDGDFDDTGEEASDNVYMVTVQATDESNKVGTYEVTVEVTNVDEPGVVTLSALRPQSQTMFNATHTDPDGDASNLKWQWAKSSSRNGAYSDIDDAIASSYTPQDSDIGSYLRVTATYTDPEGSDKSAMERSDYKVQAVRGANNAPVFPDQDPDTDGDQSTEATREVAENTAAGQAIGDPLVAEDEDGDIRTYTLSGADADSFSIDWATGQLMTKGALDVEADPSHTVTVRATDPAGVPQAQTAVEANSDEITVTITVTNVNEAPEITGEAGVTFGEVDGNIDTALDDYEADDPETGGTNNDNDVTWSVAGDDGSKFDISTAGALTFKAKPDFEAPTDANKNNVYEVTVRAADSDGNRGEMAVKVTVENENEPGTVSLSRTQIRVGVPVTADLSDPDGSVSGLTWQWYDGAVNDQNEIEDANSETYTPVADDVDDTLTAVASYTDGHGPGKIAEVQASSVVAVDTRNKPPVFDDQDAETDGVQNESTTRKVAENTEAVAADDALANADEDVADNVGSVITATDPDPNMEALIYTLGGDDADKFRVRNNGQIEVGAGTELDSETKDTYMVTVIAEDSFGESASIMVTIMVTDVDEAPGVTGDDMAEYPEKGITEVATYTAVDPEGADITSWTLAGDDADDFTIDGGVLTFTESPDYEAATDGDRNNDGDFDDTGEEASDNVYMVTVQATDESNKVGTYEVTVEVTNVDEPGVVTLSALRPQSQTMFNATHTDPDGDASNLKWQWAKSSSRNGAYSDIDDAIASSYTPQDSDTGSYLRVTATYTDPEGSDKSAMERSDYKVQAVRGANKAPVFPDQDPDTDGDQSTEATREVAENTAAGQAIGDPLVAEDEDGDIRTYTLSGADADSFSIDWATGQLMTKGALDVEADPSHTVTVRATDPAGVPQAQTAVEANSDEITVTITVTNVNEAPEITGEAGVTFGEVDGNIDTALDDYEADDPETGGTNNDNDVTWSVAGDDGSKFDISTAGALTFKAKPDFEAPTDANKNNVYEVTVRAADSDGNRGEMAVKVTVENENEPGTVSLSRTQIRVGVPVTADLSDPDGSVSGLTWQWYDGAVNDQNEIEDANSETYTPVADDVDDTLTAVASYTDGHGPGKIAEVQASSVVAVDTRNKPPVFDDQDAETDGVQNESTTRKVAENTEAVAADDALANADEDVADNVGSVITATDPDPNMEALIYTLGGDDADKFRVRNNGQIEVGAGTELDSETKDTYMVTVIAEDSFGESASIMVTIMVTDVDETPTIRRVASENQPPVTDVNEAPVAPTVANQTATKDTAFSYTVPAFTDPEGGTITYTATLSDDSALPGWLSFDVSTRELSGTPLEADTPASLTIEVSATDDGSPSASAQVTFTLTVGEEAPTTLLVRYDADKDGWIQLKEVRAAVGDYFGPPKGVKLSLDDTRKVVGLYFEYLNRQ